MATLVPYTIQELLGDDLSPGERVLWHGQPDPSVLFAKADRFFVPFSLLWGGFAFFWEGSVIASLLRGEDRSGNGGSLWLFVLFGAAFVVMGLYIVAGRFIYKRVKKKRTFYVVTDRRVLTLTTLWGRHLSAAFIDRLPSLQKSTDSGGVGTVHFGEARGWETYYENTGMDFMSGGREGPVIAFYDIHDPDTVYRLVNEIRERRRRDAQSEPNG